MSKKDAKKSEAKSWSQRWPFSWLRILGGWLADFGHWLAKEFRDFLSSPLQWLWSAAKRFVMYLVRTALWLLITPLLFLRGVFHWLLNMTVRRFLIGVAAVLVSVSVLFGGAMFLLMHWPHSQVPEVTAPDRIVYLDQGWGAGRDAPDRQLYYYTPQGTGNLLRNMRYKWFVNLEVPWGKERLADPDHMRAYGFQVDAEPSEKNPFMLPVGFTKHYDPEFREDVLDVTCATCHTGGLLVTQPDGSTVSVRIDGGQAMHALASAKPPNFVPVLIGSMLSTYYNPLKFNRFALKVLGEQHYESGKEALRAEFKEVKNALLKLGYVDFRYGNSPVEEGFGRIDALTRIGNAVFGDQITPHNYKPGTGPVSYPPVWDIWKFDWVQYSASVAQPMARNLGESLGVGAKYHFLDSYGQPLKKDQRYPTSTRILDIFDIELSLQRLRPPAWDESILGSVDRDKAARGGVHFIRTCQGCHGPHPADDRQRFIEMPLKEPSQAHWKMKTLTVQEIGTDPNAALNFVERTFDLTSTGLTIEEVREVVGTERDQQIKRIMEWDYGPEQRNPRCRFLDDPARPNASQVSAATCRKHLEDAKIRDLDAINLSAVTNGQGLNYFGLMMRERIYDQECPRMKDTVTLNVNEADVDNIEAEVRELADASASQPRLDREDLDQDKKCFTAREIETLDGFAALDIPQVLMVYKARPLGGMWATAPFLHNGSVRNLYQLLSPQHERDTTFFIGRPTYDTTQLGLAAADQKDGGFWLDTSIPGNDNTGHEFREGYVAWEPGIPPQYGVIGPAYSNEERYEIIEYFKTHLDDPPHSPLFTDVFALVVEEVMKSIPAAGDEAQIAELWPRGQACNLHEYLLNQEGDDRIDPATAANINEALARLDVYFDMPNSYICGGRTRFQRGG